MVKLRIVHKGLILVAVPLMFGIGYITLLFCGLQNTSGLIDREFLLKDALISHISTLTSGYCCIIGKEMYIATGDPAWKKYTTLQQKRAISSDQHLRKLLKAE